MGTATVIDGSPLWECFTMGKNFFSFNISVCGCYECMCLRALGLLQISGGAPVRLIKRNCDKDRKRTRRPQAAHYLSTTITRNPSEDKCPLTVPLISVAAGCHLAQHGKTSLANTQGRLPCNGQP